LLGQAGGGQVSGGQVVVSWCRDLAYSLVWMAVDTLAALDAFWSLEIAEFFMQLAD